MVCQCSVPGCGNDQGCKKNLRLHRFPWHSETLVDQWIKAIARKNWYPSKHARVCGDHFVENDYVSSSSHRLKPIAVPSRFLPVAKECQCQHSQHSEGNACKVKMSVNCTVRGCVSTKENENGINFFRFPTKPQQREQWLKILNIPPLESLNNSYVCSKHFDQKYIVTNNGNQLLLPGAIPTTFSNRVYTKNTRNLVAIQPKPSSIFPTNQNILIKPLPIVVVPLQNNNNSIPTTNTLNLNLKAQINQNFSNIQNIQTQLVKINEQPENHGFPASIPISENIVEINNCDEDEDVNNSNRDEMESVASINSDNETTQNSTNKDESCYVLVEVNDKIDDNLNSQDDANIVASGFNIKELINEAKIAINNKFKTVPTSSPTIRKVRRWRTNYIGDCVFEDMENPEIRKHHWTLALNEIQKLRRKVKALEQKTRRMQKRLNGAKLTIVQLERKNNDYDDDQNVSDDSS